MMRGLISTSAPSATKTNPMACGTAHRQQSGPDESGSRKKKAHGKRSFLNRHKNAATHAGEWVGVVPASGVAGTRPAGPNQIERVGDKEGLAARGPGPPGKRAPDDARLDGPASQPHHLGMRGRRGLPATRGSAPRQPHGPRALAGVTGASRPALLPSAALLAPALARAGSPFERLL
jgi:hypothetical protein